MDVRGSFYRRTRVRKNPIAGEYNMQIAKWKFHTRDTYLRVNISDSRVKRRLTERALTAVGTFPS